jgi:hypothetical protein
VKRLIPLILLVASSSILNAKSCSEEQIGKMIKQNLSQSTIDSICKDDKKESNDKNSNDKQIIVNITNTPVNNNANTNTNTNSAGANQLNNNENELEYFFWRIGVGKYTREGAEYETNAKYSESSFNFGLHYYINGLAKEGFGIGAELTVSANNDSNHPRTEVLRELQILYNFHFDNGFNIAPAYITGKRSYTYTIPAAYYSNSSYSSYTVEHEITKDESISGFGLYLTLPEVVKSGQGLSVFYKSLKDQHELILNIGIQFIW